MLARTSPATSILLVFLAAIFPAWNVTLLLAGRVLPWQATRGWLLLFVVAQLLISGWWWPACRGLAQAATARRRAAFAWGLGPLLGACVAFLVLLHLSDSAYGVVVQPAIRMQVAGVAIAVIAALAISARAAAAWAEDGESAQVRRALRVGVSGYVGPAILLSLIAVGTLQAAAMASPIGDDIGKYIEAALAMLDGRQYPVHQAADYLVAVGMTPNSPALPALPLLLAAGFAGFGRNFAGLTVPLAALAAVFPIAMYWACLAFTRSRLTSYAAAVLLTLFPVYQIHILGTAVPDTLFAVAVLLAAAATASAISTPTWRRWTLVGVTVGLVANSRPEGLEFSLAMMAVLGVFQWRSRLYWLSSAVFMAAVAPFAVTYMSVAGSLWPTTFGGTVGPQYVRENLAYLHDLALPWYLQAIGLDGPSLAALGMGTALAGAVALAMMWRDRPGLLFVPLLGYGYIAASLAIHPVILMSYTPVDVLRHWNSGVPYVALTLAYVLHRGASALGVRLSPSPRWVALAALVLVVALGFRYETDRLAHPEWYLGGRWSLLWTGGSYLLADVVRDPIPLPAPGDPRSGEQLRAEQARLLEPHDLRYTNGGEPYHETTMIVALFGLCCAAAPVALSIGEVRRSRIPGGRLGWA